MAINYRSDKHGPKETEQQIKQLCAGIQNCNVSDLPVRADVSDETEVVNMFDQVLEEWGDLDILVNNAGLQIEEATHETPTEDFDKVLRVNLRGAFLCARTAIRHFLDKGKEGAIVNISSVHEDIPKPGYIGYSVSKGGLRNLTRSLALEYSDRNIRINSVAPGAIVTPMNRSWIDDPEKKEAVESHIPMRRAGTAEEIAEVVTFLCSDAAAYITGQTLYVDGGLTLYPGFKEGWTS